MTKYIVLSEFTPPDHGGIQATLGPIIRMLGQDCTVVAPRTDADHAVRRSLFSGTGWPRWWWLVGYLRRARREGAEVAIFGHVSSAVCAGWIASRFFGLRYIVLAHGNDVLTEQRHAIKRYFLPFLLRKASWVGVNSAFVRDLVHASGVTLYRIVATHPFVDADMLSEDRGASRSGQRLITVARLVARKNVEASIRAVGVLRKTFPDIHLDIVGDGPERHRLEQVAQELEVQSVVTFHGSVTEQRKWELLRSSDIFVLVPIVRDGGVDVEGLGLVYLEAAAVGLPIIASATGGVSSAVQHELTGILLHHQDPQAVVDAVAIVLNNPEVAHQYGMAGQALVQKEFTDTVRLGRLGELIGHKKEQQQLPSVSIIIPAYQSADTIAATIDAVRRQTWPSREVIVVDDGSTDGLESIIAPYRTEVTYIRQDNAGAPVARNTGFDRSRGELVLFLDADTILDPSAIEEMVRVLRLHSGIDFVYSDFRFGWKHFRLHEYSESALKNMNYIHTTSLMRREVFPRFDPTLKKFQDWDLWLTIAERGGSGMWIPDTLFSVQARRRGLGMSQWLPSFLYRLPFIGQGKGNATIAAYRRGERVIRDKHHL